MGLIDELNALEARAHNLIEGAGDAAALEAARVALLGKKGEITSVMHMMGKVAPEERPVLGKRANELRRMAESLLERRGKGLRREAMAALIGAEAVDVTLPGARPTLGHEHLINQIRHEIEDVFCAIGYTVEAGPEVETSWYNFTALNAPMDHPSRSARDTFYVVDNAPGSVTHPEEHAAGESDVLLRTQTSGTQVHIMEHQKPPIYAIVPGAVYRPDTADACHLPQFHQVEGLVVDEGITFGDLKGTLDYFARAMFGPERKTRYRPHFFPFTEPSCELDVSCHVCGGKGCSFCKHSGWIEILGCGMVDPNVLINCGVDPERYTGFAFGIGVERVAALRYDLPDLRTLMTGDMRFLAQF
ncbi:phenylalanine--tRNA ligase subunit alpha [Collinsella sp. An7]|uniref:phenylalanine--tRNA ligase subunit alpha n=1 Tax=Collinsella sp. An7 TaxID=1965651 RepID=UPI000B3AF859|nr:phenylalanine--tRNA ligase subunit alpha [Collinsella sp. An7]OUN47780.1 phenylalanine--tRNA ligase subunit alpha [Collinsella sp. An7]